MIYFEKRSQSSERSFKKMITFESLKDYYDERYPAPRTDQDALITLWDVYKKEMKSFDTRTKEGIAEVYRELQSKGIPAYYWFLEAIHRTSKKNTSKQSFPYIVGTLRNWATYGFGSTLTQEEEEVFQFFNEMADVEISPEARVVITGLMSKYGAFKVMRTMPELNKVNKSLAMAEILGKLVQDKFGGITPPSQPLLQESKLVVLSSIQDSTRKGKTQTANSTKNKGTSRKDMKRKIDITVKYLKEAGHPVTPSELASMLNEKGFEKITQKNITSHLMTMMKHCSNIEKVEFGQYGYKSKASH